MKSILGAKKGPLVWFYDITASKRDQNLLKNTKPYQFILDFPGGEEKNTANLPPKFRVKPNSKSGTCVMCWDMERETGEIKT